MIKVYFVITLLFFGIFLFFCVPAYAAGTPSIFSYQGRLTNAVGNLLTGTYSFKFSIWDVATGGDSGVNRLWPSAGPTSVSAAVRDGVFNVNIGDTDGGYPNELDFNFNATSTIYLQVEVSSGGSFETLSPRQRISSAVFAQVSGAVSGTGQSSFGTTTPASDAVVTIEATTTSSIPALIRAAAGQLASLFRIEDSSLNHLFSIDSLGGIFASSTLFIGPSDDAAFVMDNSGRIGIGTTTALSRKLNILNTDDVPQLRLSQRLPVTGSILSGEFYTDSSGDVRISSTGGNIREYDENLWVCSGACDVSGKPEGAGNTGNIILEKALFFDNNFKLAPTTTPGEKEVTVYASSTSAIVPILIFDDLE